ncbi:hypothetical protein [Cyanobium sp. Morenito 9A2]|uniref:hypothetical protein n=1 Tax=Cyanobium sp. Morenito 9A2 TaxID=2823718 RepID=UPI0020CB8688|nr:hypothetical protein [Cyanobium sp. Morenito 9A2]
MKTIKSFPIIGAKLQDKWPRQGMLRQRKRHQGRWLQFWSGVVEEAWQVGFKPVPIRSKQGANHPAENPLHPLDIL